MVNYHNPSYATSGEEEQAAVISPSYYQDIVPGYQYMQLMEHLMPRLEDPVVTCLFAHLYSYMFRFGQKDTPLQEARKLHWYMTYLKDYLERKEVGLVPFRPEEN